jgi:UDP-GlcNAc:undecaprenyl-phosphate GlcNAc-1-phosphate transferase
MLEFWKIFALGFIASFVAVFCAVRFFPKLGLLDFPERYGLKRAKIPYPGGIILFLLSFFILFFDKKFAGFASGLLALGVISFIDDRKNISALFRLIAQILIAIFVFYMGIKINFIGNPWGNTNFDLANNLPILSFLLTIIWIIAIQNALNWFDGVPGLAVGVSGIGFLTLAILGIIRPELFLDPNHQSLNFANFYLASICLGCFYFFGTKKILLGDSGSQVLGFLLAIMSIFSGAKIATTLLVLALPILDFFLVIFRRIFIDKKSPFKGDLKHLHHLILAKTSERFTMILLLLISSIFGIIAIFLTGFLKLIAFLLAILLVFGLYSWAGNQIRQNV